MTVVIRKYTKMRFSEDKYTVNFSRFNGSRDDEFQLWCLRMKAALRGKKVAFAL